MTSGLPQRALGRTATKRRAILTEATALFLRHGFRGTSMDEVAAAAGVSKQTVYKQFTDKESLFREIVEGVGENAQNIVAKIVSAFGEKPAVTRDELEERLTGVARVYLEEVLQPHVLSLRRLIIGEAEEFPDLAVDYYEKAPTRGLEVIAEALMPYLDSCMLVADDARLAAAHFAHLALSVAQDRAMFVPSELPSPGERDQLARAAARVFVAAYGVEARPRRS